MGYQVWVPGRTCTYLLPACSHITQMASVTKQILLVLLVTMPMVSAQTSSSSAPLTSPGGTQMFCPLGCFAPNDTTASLQNWIWWLLLGLLCCCCCCTHHGAIASLAGGGAGLFHGHKA